MSIVIKSKQPMKKSFVMIAVVAATVLSSCVSKKKYVALEEELANTKSTLTKTTVEKEELESKMTKIERRVEEYNAKISTLTDTNNSQMVMVDDLAPVSKNTRDKMKASLADVDPSELEGATTFKDSMNVALSHNLSKSITSSLEEGGEEGQDDVTVDVDKTVVMISIADEMLFRSGSYRVNSKADKILKKLADVINSEPSMEIMVEGHTDSKTINTAVLEDNWDLSVKRATSIVRKLQNDFGVEPSKMIASGRSSYQPLVENDSAENRAKNRRTRIVLLPNLDKFLSMLSSN